METRTNSYTRRRARAVAVARTGQTGAWAWQALATLLLLAGLALVQ